MYYQGRTKCQQYRLKTDSSIAQWKSPFLPWIRVYSLDILFCLGKIQTCIRILIWTYIHILKWIDWTNSNAHPLIISISNSFMSLLSLSFLNNNESIKQQQSNKRKIIKTHLNGTNAVYTAKHSGHLLNIQGHSRRRWRVKHEHTQGALWRTTSK